MTSETLPTAQKFALTPGEHNNNDSNGNSDSDSNRNSNSNSNNLNINRDNRLPKSLPEPLGVPRAPCPTCPLLRRNYLWYDIIVYPKVCPNPWRAKQHIDTKHKQLLRVKQKTYGIIFLTTKRFALIPTEQANKYEASSEVFSLRVVVRFRAAFDEHITLRPMRTTTSEVFLLPGRKQLGTQVVFVFWVVSYPCRCLYVPILYYIIV